MKILNSILCVFLAGCMVGPNYKQPKVDSPAVYSEAKRSQDISLKRWWKKFKDPVLSQLINIALKENYDVKIAKEKILQYRALYRVAKADLFPQVDANAKALRSKISENLVNSTFLGTKLQNFFEVGFDAIWELDLFGKMRREKEAALFAVKAQIEEEKDVKLTLLGEVARLYIDIRFFQTKIALLEKKKWVEKKIYDLYKDRFESGIDSMLVKEIAFANYKNISSEIPLLDEALKQNFYALVSLLGKNPESFSFEKLKSGPIPMIRERVVAPLPSKLLRRRPDIRRSEQLLRQATSNIGVAIADLFPSFSLIGDTHQQSADLNNLLKTNSNSWNIGPIINWPIITFGKIRSNIDEKKSLQRQALLDYEKTVIDAFKEVESSLVAYFDEKKHLYLTDKALQAKLKEQHLHKDLNESGIEDAISYFNAKREALNQEDYVIESQKNLSTNLIALYKALGGGF